MAVQNVGRYLELTAYTAHLVLEKQSERLDDLQIHFFGQASHVMVRLDRGRRTVDGRRLDHVGIDRPLSEPAHVGQLLRLGVEYLDEVPPDDLAFALGIGHSFQVGEELFAGADADHVQPHRLVRFEYVLELVLAEQSHIDENADQLPADGPMQQHGRYRRVDSPGQPEQHFVRPDLFAQFGDGRFDERGGSPVLTAAADVDDKMLQQLLALGRVVHFRMELDAPCLLSVDLERGDRHVLRAGDDPVAFRNPDDRIPVRHPYLRPLGKVPDQRIVAFRFRQHGPSVLPRRRGSDLASVAMREVLGSVADAQQRQLALDR